MGLLFSLKRDPKPWQEGAGYEPGKEPSLKHDHADGLISDFQLRTVRNIFMLFISYPVCGIL